MQKSNRTGRHRGLRAARSKAVVLAGLTLTVAVVAAGCSGDAESGSDPRTTAQLNDAGDPVTVVGSKDAPAGELSVAISQALFESAPAVVIAASDDAKGMKQGAAEATSLGVPMLVIDEAGDSTGSTPPPGGDRPARRRDGACHGLAGQE